MKKFTWKRNYDREAMRGKEDAEFEWWTAKVFVINCHVTNKKGYWSFIIRGIYDIESKWEYPSKESAFDAVEGVIEERFREVLS